MFKIIEDVLSDCFYISSTTKIESSNGRGNCSLSSSVVNGKETIVFKLKADHDGIFSISGAGSHNIVIKSNETTLLSLLNDFDRASFKMEKLLLCSLEEDVLGGTPVRKFEAEPEPEEMGKVIEAVNSTCPKALGMFVNGISVTIEDGIASVTLWVK